MECRDFHHQPDDNQDMGGFLSKSKLKTSNWWNGQESSDEPVSGKKFLTLPIIEPWFLGQSLSL